MVARSVPTVVLIPACHPSLHVQSIVAGKLSPFVLQADALDRVQEVAERGELMVDMDTLVLLMILEIEFDEGTVVPDEFVVVAEFELLDGSVMLSMSHPVGNGSVNTVKQANAAYISDEREGIIEVTSAPVSLPSKSND